MFVKCQIDFLKIIVVHYCKKDDENKNYSIYLVNETKQIKSTCSVAMEPRTLVRAESNQSDTSQ